MFLRGRLEVLRTAEGSKKRTCSTEDLGTSPQPNAHSTTGLQGGTWCTAGHVPGVPHGHQRGLLRMSPSSRESRPSTLILNTHYFLLCEYIQMCQKRGQSVLPLQVPQDERNTLQDCSARWWMQHYQLGSLGENHKTQERQGVLGAYGLPPITLFLEMLQVYHQSELTALSTF